MNRLKPIDYFNERNINDVFTKKIRHKKCKGIDRKSPETFISKKELEVQVICLKCKNGTFKFSPYLENLRLKGRSKFPRVISIPTVRDRIVLSILKDILHELYPECVNRKLPNQYISDIKTYTQGKSSLFYLQTDISRFYDSIDRTILVSKLRLKISDENIIRLVEGAICTPTVPNHLGKSDIKEYASKQGIPQGLAISNILAQIYLSDFDELIQKRKYFYSRYVDDILIINETTLSNYRINKIKQNLESLKLNLNLDKTNLGKLNDGVIYLGYSISENLVSVSDKNIQRFIQRIAAKFTWVKQGFQIKTKRPTWLISDDKRFTSVFLEELNETITGAKDDHKNYGWLYYFSEMNDLNLLFRLDKIISSFFEELDFFDRKAPTDLKRLVRAYYEISFNPKSNYIYDYSIQDTLLKKRNFLIYRGQIDPSGIYKDEEIILFYEKYKFKRLLALDKDIGYKYF